MIDFSGSIIWSVTEAPPVAYTLEHTWRGLTGAWSHPDPATQDALAGMPGHSRDPSIASGNIGSAFVADLHLPPERPALRADIEAAWVANPAERGAVLRDILPPESFSILAARPRGVPVAPGGVAEAMAHVFDQGQTGSATATPGSLYSRVGGYDVARSEYLSEPGFFPLTTRPMTGFALVKEVSNDKEKVPEVRDTAWAHLLGDILPDD
jgi:hypothetical protein